jgi:hypothetical protein
MQPLQVTEGQTTLEIPVGDCEIEQTTEEATVRWQEGNRPQSAKASLAQLRAWLADGSIKRDEPA